jgi:hypothetical protein
VEAGFPVSDVVHDADAAVGLHQAVLPLDDVTVSFFPGPLDVASVRVVNTVLISVTRVVFLEKSENRTLSEAVTPNLSRKVQSC